MTNAEIDRRIMLKRQLIAVTMQEIEELQGIKAVAELRKWAIETGYDGREEGRA